MNTSEDEAVIADMAKDLVSMLIFCELIPYGPNKAVLDKIHYMAELMHARAAQIALTAEEAKRRK